METQSKMTGAELITAERRRQIESEGWTPEHDEQHTGGELALAACCYAAPVRIFQRVDHAAGSNFVDPWPEWWEEGWDKRFSYGSCRKNPGNVPPNPATYSKVERLDLLVKAGALIAAEIDRITRKG